MRDYAVLIQELDDLIKTGALSSARQKLRRIKPSQIPRRFMNALAGIGLRLNQSDFTLRILNPLVRSSNHSAATDSEKILYANALVRIGGFTEGLALLKTVNFSNEPQTYFVEGVAHIGRWDYAQSIPPLEKYIAAKGISNYQQLVGRANLVAALVYEGVNAEKDLLQLLADTNHPETRYLHGHTLQTLAQHYWGKENYGKAEEVLRQSRAILSDPNSVEALYNFKWETLCRIAGDRKHDCRPLQLVREAARKLKNYETIRNCDFHEAIIRGDTTLFAKVYFGTPYTSVKEKLAKAFGGPPSDSHIRWDRGADAPLVDFKVFDELKIGSAVHRFIHILSSDFYRPQRLATLHGLLYPNEYYNPDSSPGRVQRVARRLQQFVRAHRLPLFAENHLNAYFLGVAKPCSILFHQEDGGKSRVEVVVQMLHGIFSHHSFTLSEASKALDIPPWTLRRLLQIGVEEERVRISGQSTATRYSISNGSRLTDSKRSA